MELYLYSHQDLVLTSSNKVYEIGEGLFHVGLQPGELVNVQAKYCAGNIIIDQEILSNENHSNIDYYKLNDNAILCELKPFTNNCCDNIYRVNTNYIKLFQTAGITYIYLNNQYVGNIKSNCKNVEFITTYGNRLGVIKCNKNIIIFNNKIIYCGSYIDYEINSQYIQIYTHQANMFNIGQLIKYEFDSNQIIIRNVIDNVNECKMKNSDYNIVYFLDSIKCGRYKQAYNLLTTELKLNVAADTLRDYFMGLDDYIYLQEEDCYITLKNNKVIGVYHFAVKANLIDNIY